jgi:ankyrin repeat protein
VKRLTIHAAVLLLCVPTHLTVALAQTPPPTRSLYQAASLGDIEQIKLHIADGRDLNKPDDNQNTALALAVVTTRLEVVKLLVEAGAKVDTPSRGVPPILSATIQGSRHIVEYIVASGANVEATDAMGMTALIVATEGGYLDIVELLIANKANVNAKDKRGQTPLSIATARRQTEIAQFLRQHGAEEPPSMLDGSPYGTRGLTPPPGATSPAEPGETAAPGRPTTTVRILADPNEIQVRVAAFPGLAEAIAAVDLNSITEQRNWRQRRTDNRTMLIRIVEKQFEEEMAFVKGIGQAEKAVKTVAAVDALVAARKLRSDAIYDDLREERRAAVLAEKEATARTRTTARSRGRMGPGEPMAGNPANDPYAVAPTRPAPRPRLDEQPDEPPLEPETQSQTQAWLTSDPLDKRDLLSTVHESDLREYDALRQTAVAEEAKKTAAAIEGLMLARQRRVTDIAAKMAEEDERLQRLEDRAGATAAPGAVRGRTGRGTTGQEEQGTQRTGRRYR